MEELISKMEALYNKGVKKYKITHRPAKSYFKFKINGHNEGVCMITARTESWILSNLEDLDGDIGGLRVNNNKKEFRYSYIITGGYDSRAYLSRQEIIGLYGKYEIDTVILNPRAKIGIFK